MLLQHMFGGAANKDSCRCGRRGHVKFAKFASLVHSKSMRPERNAGCLGTLPLQWHREVAEIPFNVCDVYAWFCAHRQQDRYLDTYAGLIWQVHVGVGGSRKPFAFGVSTCLCVVRLRGRSIMFARWRWFAGRWQCSSNTYHLPLVYYRLTRGVRDGIANRVGVRIDLVTLPRASWHDTRRVTVLSMS
jgi:hypothetical protein